MTETSPETQRYSTAAMILHWLIAAAIIIQIGMGWYMGTLESGPAHEIEPIHISLGLTVLLLTALRIVIAVLHKRPPLPQSMAPLERKASKAVHVLFYVLMVALPLSGWIMESVSGRPIDFWNLTWPQFPGLQAWLEGQDKRAFKESVEQLHGSPLVWSMVGLIVLHVAGAIKHQFDGSPILWRMAPWARRP
jgi:cytochrome b561